MDKQLLNKVKEIENLYITKKSEKAHIEKEIKEYNQKINMIKKNIENYKIIEQILKEVSSNAKNNIATVLQNSVTKALQYITDNKEIAFQIEFDDKKIKPVCDMYIIKRINGKVSKQNPIDACGGGIIDIIGMCLRYLYSEIMSTPKIKNVMIFDEPGKMLSEDVSVKFASFVKDLGQVFNKQNILISHNDNIINVADSAFYVINTGNISKIFKGEDIYENKK